MKAGSNKIQILRLFVLLSLLPFLLLFTQVNNLGGISYAGGNILGLVAAVLFWWQFVLGIRFISRAITKDYVSIIGLHKWLGIYGGVLVLIHPLWMMINYSGGLGLIYQLNFDTQFQTHVSYGKIAFVLFLVVWTSSALLRKKMKFRPWMYIHYITYPMMFLIFLHALTIGSFLQTFPLLKIYWVILTGTYFLMVFYRIAKFINIGRYRYVLLSRKHVNKDISVYVLKSMEKKIVPKVGQFIFLRMSFFGEAHPFTVMSCDKKARTLQLGIKSVGPFTKKLATHKIGSTVYLDGPYGVFTRQGHSNAPKVLIAGGIGITPFIDLVEKYATSDTYLFYANREYGDALFRKKLRAKLKNNYIEALSKDVVTSKDFIVKGRLTAGVFEKKLGKDVLSEANFFVCGSPAFMKGIFEILSSLDVRTNQIYSEEFSL